MTDIVFTPQPTIQPINNSKNKAFSTVNWSCVKYHYHNNHPSFRFNNSNISILSTMMSNLTFKIISRSTNRFCNSNSGRRHLLSTVTAAVNNGLVAKPPASAPLVENFRTSWPEAKPSTVSVSSESVQEKLPPRTVSDDDLRFEMSATYDPGSSLFYDHMKMNPADFKVVLKVSLPDLNLTPNQRKVFIEMLGPRYCVGSQEIKLTAARFGNRVENKRYLIFLLENLLRECRKITAMAEQEQGVASQTLQAGQAE